MAESFDFNNPEDEVDPAALHGFAEEPPEVEEDDTPRRAASARYIVESGVGSEAMLRDAMDPANQSLADALRLSFRVLQAVIVVLVVLFLASGLKTIDDGQSGVRTLFGEIKEPLSPGLKFSLAPYPFGEFFTFKAENRMVDLGEYFSMASGGRPQATMLEQTEVSTPLNPGRDGSLITRDNDLAHLEVAAKYEIDQPSDFVHHVNDADMKRDADEMVRMALRRASVHVVGRMSVTEVSDPARIPEMKENIRLQAQAVLDEIKSGIRLVDITDATGGEPLAIRKMQSSVMEASVAGASMVEEARKQAAQTLQNVAGAGYEQISALIEQYEDALGTGDEQRSTELMAAISAKLESNEVTGEVSDIINRARSYKDMIDSTLGNEYQRYFGLLPAFKQNPQLVIRQQWLEAYNSILGRADTEIVYVPPMLASINLAISGSSAVQDVRGDLKRRQRNAAFAQSSYMGPYVSRGEEMSIDKAGRQLRKDPKTGKLVPMGTGNN
ncbi:MAG TPA: SPFH domain-containing protein [Phycisphaerales bacterium]|nr:SPFH domain-containing protein [Phycisphaerales bacterium]